MFQMEPRADLIRFKHGGVEYTMTAKEIEAAVSYQAEQNLKMDMLGKAVRAYCTKFLSRAVYGECKAFCPFHEVNNKDGNIPMCSTRYIRDHPDRVREILKQAGVAGLEE